jgi:hypothetical protein
MQVDKGIEDMLRRIEDTGNIVALGKPSAIKVMIV